MDYVRWLLALPEPGYDPSGKTEAMIKLDYILRKKQSPLWRTVGWFGDLKIRMWWSLCNVRDAIWRVTLGRWLYVKIDRHGSEANSMKFVSSRTNIPVPRVWFTPSWRGTKYTVMSRIPGVALDDAWEHLGDDTKHFIASQLRAYISQLRAIPPPDGTRICSVDGGPVQSHRLIDWDPTCGPFRDEEHMNFQLRHLRPLDTLPETVQIAHKKRHPLVFTHNDFFPRNIMIDQQLKGHVLAVIDWESSGWFPSHWEYCISHNWGKWRPEQLEWMEVFVPKIIPVYEEEAKADKMLMYDCGFEMVPINQAP